MFDKRQKGTATVRIISENGCESLDFFKLGVSSSVGRVDCSRNSRHYYSSQAILLLTLKMSKI